MSGVGTICHQKASQGRLGMQVKENKHGSLKLYCAPKCNSVVLEIKLTLTITEFLKIKIHPVYLLPPG